MAGRLADAVAAIDGVELAYPVQANGVFATLPGEAIERLRDALPAAHPFYVWDEAAGDDPLHVLVGHDRGRRRRPGRGPGGGGIAISGRAAG